MHKDDNDIVIKKLSVIVPVYNQVNYLKKCLDSICDQSYHDMEIVLVDDGSNDGSGELCDQYARQDERILVIHKDNNGLLEARRTGISNCRGRYITFVDSDDWIDQGTYSCFEEMMRNDVDLIVYGKIKETENSGITYQRSLYDEGLYDRNGLIEKIYPTMIWDRERNASGLKHSLCDKIFKRDLLARSYELVPDNSNMYNGEDSLILFPLMQWIDSVYISHKCFYHYRNYIRQVPSYISTDDFFEDAYIWFKHIADNTELISGARKQLEYAYLNRLKYRREVYGDFVHNDEFMFPFGIVPVNSRIVLYGAGRQGITFFDQVRRSAFCDIVLWVDRNPETVEGYDVRKPEEIIALNGSYDHVVIAISSKIIKEKIVEWLLEIGIDREKIV